jgi:uncharacterized repeat protein (TIGR01451 family)
MTANNPPSNPVSPSQDLIHILLPDKTVRTVTIKPEGLTIGRSPDNDLILDHPGISRHHARIEFDGMNYQVRDLNSMNGTFVEEVRLPPDAPRIWLPGESLRMGEIWLRLERAEQSQATAAVVTRPSHPQPTSQPVTQPMGATPPGRARTPAARPPDSSIDLSQVKYSSGEGRVGVYTEAPSLSVTPGKSVTVSMLLFNRGQAPDIFRLSVQGIPPEWIPNPPQAVSIPGGEQKEIQVAFKPPRSPDSRAGRHAVTVRVASQQAPDQVVEERLTITVAAFSQFSSELRPKLLWSGGHSQIMVHNQGNLPENFTLTFDDKLGELAFDPPEARLTVPPGHSASVDFRASLIQTRLLGGEMRHTFGIIVSAQSGQYQSHAGELLSRGLIPSWTPAVLGILSAAMCCIVVLFYFQLTAPAREAKKTDIANQTAISLIAQATYQAATKTASALVNANLATIQAVTATAAWQTADDDGDGLANTQELLLGTKPDVADTDGDGLKDGDEVNLWKTNPLIQDTDGDGLSDGYEVQHGTNPLKKDTDGDGLEDGVDPDSLHPPTTTPRPSVTFTATPTRPTNTPTPPAVPTADLSISINNGQSALVPGTNVVYTILVANKGPSPATNVQVVDNFPGSLSNLSWSCNASVGSRCQVTNGTGNINTRIDLAVGGTITILSSATVAPNATGVLINSASVIAPPGINEPNTVDNLAVDTDTLSPKVSYTFSKTDGRNNIIPGQATTYTIVATNNGPSMVTGVNITDFFPDSIMNVTWSCNASPGSSCGTTGLQSGNVNVNVNLSSGGTVTITANGTVKNSASGNISNTAFLYSPVDPMTNNKTATDTTAITQQADLAVEVVAPFTVTVGTPVTYTLTIANNGPSNATNVVLTDLLPAGTTFVSFAGVPTCAATGGKVICNLGTLPSGGVVQIKIIVMAPASSGMIINVADVKSNETDPNPTNDSATTNVQVE